MDTSGRKSILNTDNIPAVPTGINPSTATNQNATATNQASTATNQATQATNIDSSRNVLEVFPLLSAPGKLWHAQIPAGAAVDIAAGFATFLPRRGLRVTMGAGAVACNVVVDAMLTNGTPVTVTFETTGPGTYELPPPFNTYAYLMLTRVQCVIDPVGTIDLETNGTFAISNTGSSGSTIDYVSTDDVNGAETTNGTLGTIVPTTPPDGTHTYAVQYQLAHTHSQNVHTHVQDAHSHTQDAHSHTQNPHAHALT